MVTLEEILSFHDGARVSIESTEAVNLDYNLAGPEADDCLILLPGLGMQRIEWSISLLSQVHEMGFKTLTLDNRDVGLSTRFVGTSSDAAAIYKNRPSYDISDMANDALSIVSAHSHLRFHLFGISMGGMVAQEMARAQMSNIATLTSVMSSTGDPAVGHAEKSVRWIFRDILPTCCRMHYLDYKMRHHNAVSASGAVTWKEVSPYASATWRRGVTAGGLSRQLAAIGAAGNRTAGLADVEIPTLVIHGDRDPVIDLSGGKATAAAIPHARLMIIEEMGHYIEEKFEVAILKAVAAHAERADRR